MKQMRINPAQLGAFPYRDEPNRWLLSNADQQEMMIACADADQDMFTVTIRIASLLPEAQAYQLAAALMLNRDATHLNGGAVAYDIHDDSFLYCKVIDARLLTLSAFGKETNEGFAAARILRDLLLYAQEDIGPGAPPVTTSSIMNLLTGSKL